MAPLCDAAFDANMAMLNVRRAGGALLCLSAVVFAHVLLLSGGAPKFEAKTGPRAPSVQVRQLVMPGVVANTESGPLPAHRMPPRAAARAAQAAPALRAATVAPLSAAPEPIADVAAADPTPPLPTRVPPSTVLTFDLRRGAASGGARLSWQLEGERYALQLLAFMPHGREVEQHSQGAFDAAGLAPLRLADRRRGRDVRAANFQREQGKITFSGPRWQLPLTEGSQDRVSWLVQLVAIAGGAPGGLREGSEVAMWVVGARGGASHWRFEMRGHQSLATPGGAMDTLWLVREPAHPYDMRVEVWLDPMHGHWPLRLLQTQVPGGEPLEWTLRGEPEPLQGT